MPEDKNPEGNCGVETVGTLSVYLLFYFNLKKYFKCAPFKILR